MRKSVRKTASFLSAVVLVVLMIPFANVSGSAESVNKAALSWAETDEAVAAVQEAVAPDGELTAEEPTVSTAPSEPEPTAAPTAAPTEAPTDAESFPFSAPQITVIANTAKGAQITWDRPAGAAFFRVYYLTKDGWSILTSTNALSCTDTAVRDGETRVYTVRCLDQYGRNASDIDSDGWSNTFYIAPVMQSVTYQNGSYTITWTANSALSSFCVYRREPSTGRLLLLGRTTGVGSFTDSTAKKDSVYAYTVCAVNGDGVPVTPLAADSQYYKNGVLASSAAGNYRYEGGEPATGYFKENGTNYYYRNGERVEQSWYKSGRFQGTLSRTNWLYELMCYSGTAPAVSRDDSASVFALAKSRGIIGDYDESDYARAFDRLYVAHTLVRALGYPTRSIGTVSDSTDTGLITIAYYGWFIPDSGNKLYPKAKITAAEFDMLLSELELYRALHGKSLLTFGDSICYGSGNYISSASREGIAAIIGKKYGMSYKSYAIPGAVMGKSEDKSHIADQVRKAISEGAKADLILLNGGTNDTWHTDIALGTLASGYNMSSSGESDFTNGFEKTMWLITNQWRDTPVVYFRSHKMALGTVANQGIYGDCGLAVAEKWKAAGVDLYRLSGLDGSIRANADRYTYDNDDKHRGIHPNALGYAQFYLPHICAAIAASIDTDTSLIGDADGDGSVTVMDVTLIQRVEAGMPSSVSPVIYMQGDVDKSGAVDITDATWIGRHICGLTQPYAIG